MPAEACRKVLIIFRFLGPPRLRRAGAEHQCAESAGRSNRHRGDHHERLCQRVFVGDTDVDARFESRGNELCEACRRAPSQFHRRASGRKVDYSHVAPPHALPDAGAERLGAGLLGGEALRIGFHALGAPLGARALRVGEDAREKTVALPRDQLLDGGDGGDVRADADDHRRAGPRSIAARMAFTVLVNPPKMASPTRKCPMLSSTISGNAEIVSAVARSSPCPAWTSSPSDFARVAPFRMRSNSIAAMVSCPSMTEIGRASG